MLASLEGHEAAIDCVAKNFETLEPGSSFRLLRQWMSAHMDASRIARHIVCCGTPKSQLEKLCTGRGLCVHDVSSSTWEAASRRSPPRISSPLPMPASTSMPWSRARETRSGGFARHHRALKDNAALRYAQIRHLAWERGMRVELLSSFERLPLGRFPLVAAALWRVRGQGRPRPVPRFRPILRGSSQPWTVRPGGDTPAHGDLP